MTLRNITMGTTTNEAIRAATNVIFTSFADTSLDAEPVLCTPSGTGFCVLFFDGGARGNPGPGGTGAIIVTSVDTPERPQVHWMCSVSLARSSTTDNVTELKPSCSDFAKHLSTNYVASMSSGIVISFLGTFEGANRRRPDTYKIFNGSAGYWLTN